MAPQNRLAIDDKLNALGTNLLAHIKAAMDESEARIIKAAGIPENYTDRFLRWLEGRKFSWLMWPVLIAWTCFSASVWHAWKSS